MKETVIIFKGRAQNAERIISSARNKFALEPFVVTDGWSQFIYPASIQVVAGTIGPFDSGELPIDGFKFYLDSHITRHGPIFSGDLAFFVRGRDLACRIRISEANRRWILGIGVILIGVAPLMQHAVNYISGKDVTSLDVVFGIIFASVCIALSYYMMFNKRSGANAQELAVLDAIRTQIQDSDQAPVVESQKDKRV